MTNPTGSMLILVLEDEALIAMTMEGALAEAGYEVESSATVQGALSLLDSKTFHAAVIDVGLRTGSSMEVAEALTLRNVPFVFCTGSTISIDPRFNHVPVVNKPFRDADLIGAINQILGMR
jgi:CheY-like chemotaxis protein